VEPLQQKSYKKIGNIKLKYSWFNNWPRQPFKKVFALAAVQWHHIHLKNVNHWFESEGVGFTYFMRC
jgi:hypothetical protein